MQPVTIQLFGDSTMVGSTAETGGTSARAPGVVLQEILDSRFGRGSTAVTVRAVGGTTAAQLVAGSDGLNLPWPGSVTAHIVVVNHGINDATHRGGSVAAYRSALQAIVADSRGALLVFETPNAVAGPNLAAYAQAMAEVAAAAKVPVADTFALPPELTLLGDWAHPTGKGYENIVSRSLGPAIVPLVARLRCETQDQKP